MSYGSLVALRDVDLEVSPGEVFGLLGANGAGKTTALECVLGLRKPDFGKIEVNGMNVAEKLGSVMEIVGAQIQGASLQDRITPRRALGLFASFYRHASAVMPLAQRFGLEEKLDAPFDTLSTGQRQRLFLALALVNDPRLVVLDEPTAGLDPRARRDLHDLIRSMRSQGRTVLMSTHDLNEAASLCDRVGIIDSGRLLAVGTPASIISSFCADSAVGPAGPSLEEAFLRLTGRPWSPGTETES
ncbi:MAG TPA: ABC transporter ATP-binding protein [Opitutaceae bacterium]|jgi:ABC-2 type transport system ATP-binding protein|nr:ABC transporter ATP-binding protein [Opitutaceae bacterium]